MMESFDNEVARDPRSDSILASDAPTSNASLDTADLHAQVGDYGSALQIYEAVRRATGPELGLVRRIAYCQERLGRYRQAVLTLEPVLQALPDGVVLSADERRELVRARLVLGKSYLETGSLPRASAEAEQALALLAGERNAERGFADNLLGIVALRGGSQDDAQTHFRRALECFRSIGDVNNLALAYTNLGYIYKERCDWNRAVEHYQAAFFLSATEGEHRRQAALHQNLGLVEMKLGRFEEARDHLESALTLAIQTSEPARAFRARLALGRWCREAGDARGALAQFHAAREGVDAAPERDCCLLLLEEAWLARDLDQRDLARSRALEARARIERMAAHGDLMIESRLLESELAQDDGEFEEAQLATRIAVDLARADRDRYLEGQALRVEMRLSARAGRYDEAERIFKILEDRHRYGDEKPALAELLETRGELEFLARGDAARAQHQMNEARELWRRMGRPHRQTGVELNLAQGLAASGQFAEARALFDAVVERVGENPDLALAGRMARVERVLRSRPESGDAPPLDAERVLDRLEEIMAWDVEPVERARAAVRLIGEAVRADGVWLGARQDGQFEVVTSVSMARLGSRRSFRISELGLDDVPGPQIVGAPPVFPDSGHAEVATSALALPGELLGRQHLLVLERRGRREPFTRPDLNYASVLWVEATRRLQRVTNASISVEGELERLIPGTAVADVITQDSQMLSILSLIHRVSDTDLSVLLQGETGTGKKLLAHAVHRISARRARTFVTVDCAALPDTLLESELFGHRKGAFTGAIADRVGLLEVADGGTVFLDEIDKAGLPVQRRFLHLLDSGEIRPVGATAYRSLDVRVVCATSCSDLRQEVAEGRFLKDLYYRLNDIAVVVPALRERPDDVRLLTDCFVEKFSRQLGRDLRGVTAAFHDALRHHSWPGNVRELEKAIRRAVTLADPKSWLVPALLPAAVLEGSAESRPEHAGKLRARLEAYECKLIVDTLERLRWNKSRSAVELGLSRKGLKGKIERYQLDRRHRS